MTGNATTPPGGDSIVLIGVGNEYRSDDGAGVCVIRELRRRGLRWVRVIEATGEATALMRGWEHARAALVVDAICSGRPPGTVCRIDMSRTPLLKAFLSPAAHSLGVAEAVELSRTLHTLPETALLYGIEGMVFEQGRGLSDPVLRGIPALLTLIQRDLSVLRLGDGAVAFPPAFTIL